MVCERHRLQSYVIYITVLWVIKQYCFGTFYERAETSTHVGIQLAQAGTFLNAMLQHAHAYYKCISHNSLSCKIVYSMCTMHLFSHI